MYKFLLPLFALAVVSGCSSSSGESSDNSSFNWTPGIYIGNFTPTGETSEESVVIVTSDNRFLFAETDSESVALGIVSGATLSTTGFNATLTGNLSGTFIADTVIGTFSLTDSGLYNRARKICQK